MAHAIARAGFPLSLWARRAETLAPFEGTGARVAPDLAALAAGSDVVGVCVTADADVEQVAHGGLLEGLSPGSILVVHSTVHPETCRRLGADAAGRDVAVLDAPVSGGGDAARAGRLAVMVGGEAAVYERCRPVFEAYGDPVRHLGALGAGQLCKILNNLLFTAQLGLARQLEGRAGALGLDPSAVRELLLASSARNLALQVVPTLLDPAAAAPFGNLVKDQALFAALAQAAGIEPEELEAAAAAGARAVAASLEAGSHASRGP